MSCHVSCRYNFILPSGGLRTLNWDAVGEVAPSYAVSLAGERRRGRGRERGSPGSRAEGREARGEASLRELVSRVIVIIADFCVCGECQAGP